MSSDRAGWLRLGVLTAPWGVRGEVKVHLDADPAYAGRLKHAYLGRERRPIDLAGVMRRGKAYTVKLSGVDSIEAAEALRGLELSIPRSEAPPLPDGHFFVEDVMGLRAVTTDGRDLGVVVEVIATAANDVYVVRGAAGDVLIPAIRDVVVSLDPSAGLLRIEPIPGLLADA